MEKIQLEISVGMEYTLCLMMVGTWNKIGVVSRFRKRILGRFDISKMTWRIGMNPEGVEAEVTEYHHLQTGKGRTRMPTPGSRIPAVDISGNSTFRTCV